MSASNLTLWLDTSVSKPSPNYLLLVQRAGFLGCNFRSNITGLEIYGAVLPVVASPPPVLPALSTCYLGDATNTTGTNGFTLDCYVRLAVDSLSYGALTNPLRFLANQNTTEAVFPSLTSPLAPLTFTAPLPQSVVMDLGASHPASRLALLTLGVAGVTVQNPLSQAYPPLAFVFTASSGVNSSSSSSDVVPQASFTLVLQPQLLQGMHMPASRPDSVLLCFFLLRFRYLLMKPE